MSRGTRARRAQRATASRETGDWLEHESPEQREWRVWTEGRKARYAAWHGEDFDTSELYSLYQPIYASDDVTIVLWQATPLAERRGGESFEAFKPWHRPLEKRRTIYDPTIRLGE